MANTRTRHSAAGAQFLDPAVLGRITNLELLARTVVDGFLTGLHRSPYLGFSMDFAEHRPYMPGDDIRRIDWKLYARTDRHYIKLFEADTNANFSILLDLSASMSYGSHSLTKLDYARYLAACLAYFSNKQRDRVGLVTFDHEVVDYVPPSMKHLDTILHTLDQVTAYCSPINSANTSTPSASDTLRLSRIVAKVEPSATVTTRSNAFIFDNVRRPDRRNNSTRLI